MSPRSRPRSGAPGSRRSAGPAVLVLIALLAAVLGACSPQFDASGPCTQDGRVAGAYPTLEAVVPTEFDGRKPDQLDSGRACTAAGLGALGPHGIKELRFAGATWSRGSDSGLTLATFVVQDGPPLTAAMLEEFFETSARAGKNIQSLETGTLPVSSSIEAKRMDVLNGESFQTVVVWERDGQVHTALVASFIRDIQTREAHDAVVKSAVASWPESG